MLSPRPWPPAGFSLSIVYIEVTNLGAQTGTQPGGAQSEHVHVHVWLLPENPGRTAS